MKFCPLFKRSCLLSFPITAQSGGWEEEGGAGYLLDSSEGSFFPLRYWCPVLVPVECS